MFVYVGIFCPGRYYSCNDSIEQNLLEESLV